MANNEETQNQNIESDGLKFAIPEKGYGVYLKGILPEDQRVLAGAFSTSMQQITNISQVQLEKFAQAAYSNENMFGLNLVNGTDVPTDVRLARISQDICAVGGGVYGTFTMSNFFGAMSGLPYPLREIYDGIKQLETEKLTNIYQELYLAVKWEQAYPNVVPGKNTYAVQNGDTGAPDYLPLYDYYYTITSATWAGTAGGGYGRGTAPAPTGIISGGSGATVTTTIGSDPNSVPGSYGQVVTVTLNSAGSPVLYSSGNLNPNPSSPPATPVELQAPPTATLAVQGDGSKATGGTNTAYLTAGWPDMNAVVTAYCTAADAEILSITTSSANNFELSNILNNHWNVTGKALKQEQRARYISIAPVPIPFDQWIATYPTSQYVFVDGIPTLAANTLPHMYAQTLENISDLDFTGGQSVVAMMRESRNEERLNRAGLELDNNLASDMSDQDKEQLLANGTLPGAIGDEGINGYTIPTFAGETPTGDLLPLPETYYDPCVPGLVNYDTSNPYVTNTAVAAILSAPELPPETPFDELPETPFGYEAPDTDPILPTGSDVTTPDNSFPCEGDRIEPLYGAQPAPIATPTIGTGPGIPTPPADYPLGVNQPTQIIPPTLDRQLTASTLLPSTPNVQQAIDKVIACNCDCWVA